MLLVVLNTAGSSSVLQCNGSSFLRRNVDEDDDTMLFSGSQFQEFERQKRILNYMVASIPVPPHLLIHMDPNSSSHSLSSLRSGDEEPWRRCKRTDGRKWRCSRDAAAPQHKYCQRHSHISRSTRKLPFYNQNIDNNQNRWFIRDDHGSCNNNVNNEQWRQQLQQQHGQVSSLLYQPSHDDQFQSFVNPSYTTTFNEGHSLFDDSRTTKTRHFMDTWPDKGGGENSRRNKLISPSSLNLSLSTNFNRNYNIDDEQDQDKEGNGILMMKPQAQAQACWMNSNESTLLRPGGPLGEALYSRPMANTAIFMNLPSSPSYDYRRSIDDDDGSLSYALNFINSSS